jgi:fumarate hydratase class II
MGYDSAVAFAGAGGHLEMNVYKPLMIFNVIQSIRILADGCRSFTSYLVQGMQPNRKQIQHYLERSLMLVTALAPEVGYDRAARIAHHAYENDLTLKEAAQDLTDLSADELDRLLDPRAML